eukprot:TRINITY_DN14346_c0_g1_i1.p1 TRINITY_DN14346_c0_g1~~TRINITY_DN14346_c0_g1_i1.p1  ORF type:complete len:1220 (+),score=176.52 TRINITY_DN14346_c0_g1_i1:84-3743(+)
MAPGLAFSRSVSMTLLLLASASLVESSAPCGMGGRYAECGRAGDDASDQDAARVQVSLLQQKWQRMLEPVEGETKEDNEEEERENKENVSSDAGGGAELLELEDARASWHHGRWHHGHGHGGNHFKTGSCEQFGCSWRFIPGRDCQCSWHCRVYDNCCDDYGQLCAEEHRRQSNTTSTTTTTDPKFSCENYGCSEKYVHEHHCQCMEDCFDHHNCCGDYGEKCAMLAVAQRRRRAGRGHCIGDEKQECTNGATRLAVHQACDPRCPKGFRAMGPWVCSAGGAVGYHGPGCVKESDLPKVPPSRIDSVPDATSQSDMVFTSFGLVNGTRGCLLWPQLKDPVQKFILQQAGKYGPSQSAIRAARSKLPVEYFLNYEQVSILLAQLLCGATEHALWRGLGRDLIASHLKGTEVNPQAYAFGRAMEHWYFSDSGKPRNPAWRRTTLVGYGTFKNDAPVPNASSRIHTGSNLTVASGCNNGQPHDYLVGADDGLGDSQTLTVVFAGHWVGGFMSGWSRPNNHGAQEEKFGTIVPEMMLATEPLRHMGAGLLSNGDWDPWKPMAGWYIIGAGTFVKGSYPFWTPEPVKITDKDYIPVGRGRRMRRRGLVGILANPCNNRPGCSGNGNSEDIQYRCYNQQVDGKDIRPAPEGSDLWGIAGGAYNFNNWPKLSRSIMLRDRVPARWTLQAGGWGSGAFGCGALYGGLVQLLAAKKGGWQRMRMCWASKEESFPTIRSKLGYAVGQEYDLKRDYVKNVLDTHESLLLGEHVDDFKTGKIIFTDERYGPVAGQLHRRIEQYEQLLTCTNTQCQNTKTGLYSPSSTCLSRMTWCCQNTECGWHRNKRQDIRDFVARSCNHSCSGVCIRSEDVPAQCQKKGRGAEHDERSCAVYGCGDYRHGQHCQCSLDCRKHQNCCADFDRTCQQGPYLEQADVEAIEDKPSKSCVAYGCSEKWTAKQHCQCAEMCLKYGNCCRDYHAQCVQLKAGRQSGRGNHNTTIPEIQPVNSSAQNKSSCEFYGCSYVHQRFWKCQCYPGCNEQKGRGSCCLDMKNYCGDLKVSQKSCAHYGCSKDFKPAQSCQCTESCTKYNSCCEDYERICNRQKIMSVDQIQNYVPRNSTDSLPHNVTVSNDTEMEVHSGVENVTHADSTTSQTSVGDARRLSHANNTSEKVSAMMQYDVENNSHISSNATQTAPGKNISIRGGFFEGIHNLSHLPPYMKWVRGHLGDGTLP